MRYFPNIMFHHHHLLLLLLPTIVVGFSESSCSSATGKVRKMALVSRQIPRPFLIGRRRRIVVMSMSKSSNDIGDNSGGGGLQRANQLISKSISIGVPQYNSGNIDKCAEVYKSAAKEVLRLGDLPHPLEQRLKETLDKIRISKYDDDDDDDNTYPSDERRNANSDDADADAWALRRIFDEILEYSPPFLPQCADCLDIRKMEPFQSANKYELFPDQPTIVNDGVMGGLSTCQWIDDTQTMKGIVSLQNNGGFASLRWRFPIQQDWNYAKGIYINAKHSIPNQHTFKFLLKDSTCEQYRGANYKVTFANPDNCGDPILIPFTSFDNVEQMGRSIGKLPINPSSITEMGIMAIKPTVVGDFEVKIKEWGLYY